MSETPSTEQTPQRMSTRNQVRVNYSESTSANQASGDKPDAVFRSPTASTRGRKKRPANLDVSELSASLGSLNYNTPPKRGRPRGGMVGGTRSRAPAVRRAATEETEHEERELVAAVKSGKRITEVVDKWIGKYNEKYLDAISEMHQFFFAICGCKGVITPQMSATMPFKDIICRMTEDFEEESADYPLVHGGNAKKFRVNVHNLLHSLISRCKASLLFDHQLMDGFVQLLTGMADSQVRAFRHTATFCALKITSALVDVTIELTSSRDKTTKQLEAEKAKLKNNTAGNEKYEALMAQRTQTDERAEEIRQIIGYLFRSVFVHRYRDVVPDIRCICITELGHWMNIYPEHFVEDSYLKYIGWSLFDKCGEVRLKCIRALIPLFEKNGMLDKLELFVNKFKARLVSMVLDKDLETSIETCHLMRVIYTVFPTLLQIEDVVPIYELIYAANRPLAMAAGMFLNTKVFLAAEKPTKVAIPRNIPLIKDLITFFIEGECHEHGTYIVDSLIETNHCVKDFASMGEMLLDDKYQYDENFESKLIEILTCAVRQTSTGESPVGRQMTKRGALSTKEARDHQDERQRLTDILIPIVPRLLIKYGADKDKVINLVDIPLHFLMDTYVSSRNQTHLIELMDALDSLVEKHVDEEVLKAVAELYYHLTSSPAVSAVVDGHKMKLLDGISAFLRTSMQQFEDEQMGEEEEALFVSYIKRMAAFAGFMDLKHLDLWDMLLKIVSNYNREDTRRDVRERSIQMLFVQLVFDFINLRREGETPKADQVRKLKKRRDQLLRILTETLSSAASGVEQAYLSICDIMLMFGSALGEESKVLEPLIWRPNDIVIGDLKLFLKVNVFTHDDLDRMDQMAKIELMHKMRQLVAQFAKLIIHGALPISDASELMRRYQSHFTDFGDIFKNLLSKCREIHFVETGVMIVETLKDIYIEMNREHQTDPLSEPFTAIRDLAKRLAPAFGSDYSKNRYAVSSLHKKAIDFAFEDYNKDTDPQPPNIYFLEIAIEFSGKLLAQDKTAVARYLSKVGLNRGAGLPSTWEPYSLYLISLTDRSDDDNMSVRSGMTVSSNATMRSNASSTRGRGRGRRQRVVDDF